MTNEVLQAIADRRSIRNYADAQVTNEQLAALIAAAEQAPSAVNRQPYHFVFVRDRALLKGFSEDFYAHMDAEQTKGEYFDVLRGAPMVCFIFETAQHSFSLIDCGIAVENLALAAHSMGLGSVILGMPRQLLHEEAGEKWMKAFGAPEGSRFAIAIGVGTPLSSKDAHPVREGLVSVID